MRAQAHIRAEQADDGGLRLPVLRSEVPLVLRRTSEGVTLVAGAGGPLGDDHLMLEVEVGAGACCRVGSAAATVVQPGLRSGETTIEIDASVAADGMLVWEPEPTVIAAEAQLSLRTTLWCAPGASVHWREVVALGRYGEGGGTVTTSMMVDGEMPVLRQSTALGASAPDGWDGPAVLGGHRVLGTLILLGRCSDIDPDCLALAPLGVDRAVLRLESGGLLLTALGASTLNVMRALEVPPVNGTLESTSALTDGADQR